MQEIQQRFGYLKREALEEFARESSIPLYRLQEVASFFPHFRLTPGKKVVVRVCRDMACGLSGSAALAKELAAAAGEDVEIQGVSCLGRCDRAPAVSMETAVAHQVSVHDHSHDHEHEYYYLGRSAAELQKCIEGALKGAAPASDSDTAHVGLPPQSVIDPYSGKPSDYAAVRKAVTARNAAINAGMENLQTQPGWELSHLERFRQGCIRQMHVEFDPEPQVATAVKAWQTECDWAKGEKLGGWSEPFFRELEDADLRGLGGAGIPSATKWRDVRDAVRTARRRASDDRAFIVVNGDESEPGTFKDRELLLRTPHLIVEAVILAGLLTEASQGFIYIRHEYTEQIAACRAEIQRAEQLGVCGLNAAVLGRSFPVSVFVSPGGYICGEQSALIEAMSDRRGEPRNMPPKLETNGLIDLPTLVSNVETYGWVPFITLNTGKYYSSLGANGWHGRRLFSISGDVKRPGVYEVPMGLTLRELVYGEDYCQGMVNNVAFKAIAPSGPSGGFLPARLTATGLPRNHTENKEWQALAARRGFDPAAKELDVLDLELELNVFRALSPTSALGAGIVIYGEGRDMAAQAVNSLEFFRNESCGKCVPCRIGSQKLASLGSHLLEGKIGSEQWSNDVLPLVREMSTAIELSSICGLGRSVPMPFRTVSTFFADDIAGHFSSQGLQAKPAPTV